MGAGFDGMQRELPGPPRPQAPRLPADYQANPPEGEAAPAGMRWCPFVGAWCSGVNCFCELMLNA